MTQQTEALKKAKRTLRERKKRAYAIVKEMALAMDMTIDEYLDWYESK